MRYSQRKKHYRIQSEIFVTEKLSLYRLVELLNCGLLNMFTKHSLRPFVTGARGKGSWVLGISLQTLCLGLSGVFLDTEPTHKIPQVPKKTGHEELRGLKQTGNF
jgi:hypothetical protein